MNMLSGIAARRRLKLQLAQAEDALRDLLEQRQAACCCFNSVCDPALLEASILELSAVQKRYGLMLRRIKELNEEVSYAASHSFDFRRNRSRADLVAAEAAEKTPEMGV